MIASTKSARRVRSSRKATKAKKPDAAFAVRQLNWSIGEQQWSHEKWAELLSDMELDFDTVAANAAIERNVIKSADDNLKTLSAEKLLALRQWLLNSDADDGGAVLSELPPDHPERITRGIALKVLAAAFEKRAPKIEHAIQSLEHSQF